MAILFTTSQCGREHKTLVVINTSSCHLHKSNINKKDKKKIVWTDVSTAKSNVTTATQEVQDTLTGGSDNALREGGVTKCKGLLSVPVDEQKGPAEFQRFESQFPSLRITLLIILVSTHNKGT